MPEVAPGRLSGRGPIAVVDIGSNSVRIVIYERLTRAPTPLYIEKVLAGLGKGLASTGRLSLKAVEDTLSALRRFRRLADQTGCVETHVLATAAVRDAVNGSAFIGDMERTMGAPVRILSGEEEARFAALGVLSGFHRPDGIAGDLGGGSLELIDVRDSALGEGVTFPLGGIRLSETAGGSIRKAERIAAEFLAGSPVLAAGKGRSFYAVGGTWRSLGRLHLFQAGYPLRVIHGYAVRAAEILDFCRELACGPIDAIDGVEVVSSPRRDLLPFGALVLGEIVRASRVREVVFSALGLREGFLYDRLDAAERARDPLLAAAEELAILRSRSPAHAAELVPWTAQVFAALGLDETPEEARLRAAACHLADIGWRAHPDYRGEQSLNIIAHAHFVGIDHPGRAFLALSNFYRHEGGAADEGLSQRLRELAPLRLRERARVLGAAFRVAYPLSAAMSGVIPRVGVDAKGGALRLFLPKDLAPLDGDRLRRRLKQLAKLRGFEARVEVG